MGSSQNPSTVRRRGKEVEIRDCVLTHRDRLHQALMLGIRLNTNGGRRWQSADAMISNNAIKMMCGFMDHLSPKLLNNGMIKESVGYMLIALEGILQIENDTVLSPAVVASTKLFKCLGNSLFQYDFCGILSCLLKLLCSNKLPIVISTAKSLNKILEHIDGPRRYTKEILCIFEKSNAISCIINSIQGYEGGVQPVEYFLELVSLLKEIALIWPTARYSVWKRTKMMENLGRLCETLDSAITIGVLQLYNAIALCDDVAVSFVESKQPFMSIMLSCMESSASLGIRIEAFRLCQKLVRSEEACLSLLALCGEEVVQRIADVLGGGWLVSVESVFPDDVLLMKEACHAAQMACWSGKHQGYLWKHAINKVLFYLLTNDGRVGACQKTSKFMDLVGAMHREFPQIINSMWNILQLLSMNCVEEIFSSITVDLHHLNIVISSACSLMADGLLRERHRHCPSKPFVPSMFLPLFKATLSMVFSPCKTLALQARCHLSEMLIHDVFGDHLQYILNLLRHGANEEHKETCDNLIRVITLACYSSLSEWQHEIIEKGGLNTLLIMLKRRLTGETHPDSYFTPSHVDCCCSAVDKSKGFEDTFLLCILQALSQLIPVSIQVNPHQSKILSVATHDDSHGESVLDILLQIPESNFSRRVKWYSAYCLSFFGHYGFPSRIGRRMWMALDDTELTDSQLILFDKKVIDVHHVILMCRCPSLLPPVSTSDKSSTNGSSEELASKRRLSSRVGRSTLQTILEFVYAGYCRVEENDSQPLRILSRSCGLESLNQMLQRKPPMCYSSLPRYDFTLALTPLGHFSSDVILEAEETEAVWSCSMCQLLIPHIHAHRIILCSNSSYFHALFHSGMQESSRSTIKVPLPWKALVKLVQWFYSGELPEVRFGCKWTNLDQRTQLDELVVYMQISELAEMWCLDEVRQKSIGIVVSCLELNKTFPIQILQSAFNLRQGEILVVALNCLAPSYNRLHDSGELEELDLALIEMLREKFVSYSLKKVQEESE